MMARAQIALEPESHRLARRRAGDLGISLAEYVRRLVARDLAQPKEVTGIESIFDLGSSGGSDVARDKHSMIEEAFDAEAASSIRRNPHNDRA